MNYPISAVLRTGQELTNNGFPLFSFLALAGSQAASSAGSAISNNRQLRSQEQLSRESLNLDREQGLMRTGLEESLANPFRHQMDQAGSIARLDAMQNASYMPSSVQMPDRYAQYAPKLSGGFSFQMSPEARQSAGKLKQSVMAGRTAPSMTSPDNFGKTATLDLTSTADPTTDAAFSTGAPNRDSLGAPAAPKLRPPVTLGKFSPSARAHVNASRRAEDIAAFERSNPGWTVDNQGRVIRKARD